MSFEFRSDPAARKEWILNRTVMHKLHNGRFDMDVQMIDDDGDLVATVRHSCSMFPHKRGKKAMQKASMLWFVHNAIYRYPIPFWYCSGNFPYGSRRVDASFAEPLVVMSDKMK
jgi:hypothetical protein